MRSLCVVALILTVGYADAADPPAEARAKAALALAKAKGATVATAPAPRVVPRTWGEAKAMAMADGKPVCVYVGCPVPKGDRVGGAHSVSVPEWEGYPAHTLVVCYPRNGMLYPDADMPCGAESDAVEKAVKKAAAKSPAPKKTGRLDWN